MPATLAAVPRAEKSQGRMGVPRKVLTKQLAAPQDPAAMWMPMVQGAIRPTRAHSSQNSRATHRALATSTGKVRAKGLAPYVNCMSHTAVKGVNSRKTACHSPSLRSRGRICLRFIIWYSGHLKR